MDNVQKVNNCMTQYNYSYLKMFQNIITGNNYKWK
jgi:hypothetical protein